jgi:hypothetical protein
VPGKLAMERNAVLFSSSFLAAFFFLVAHVKYQTIVKARKTRTNGKYYCNI